jgi:NADPH2:quinone reductase
MVTSWRPLEGVRSGGRTAYPNGIQPVPEAPSGVRITPFDADYDRELMDSVNRRIEGGPFEVHVARTIPLEAAAEAHRALETRHFGRLAIQPA